MNAGLDGVKGCASVFSEGNHMNKEQAQIATAIYGVIGVLMGAASCTAAYGVVKTMNPALVGICGLFGILGALCAWAVVHCAKQA